MSGPVARGRRTPARALGRVCEVVRTDVLVRGLSSLPAQPVRPRGLDVHRVDGVDGLGWVPPHRRRKVAPFLQRGDCGYVATVEGEFAGWVWVSRISHRDPWSGLVIRLAPDEAYAYALDVVEEFRPSGVPRALMVSMLSDVATRQGASFVYGWVDRRNRESEMLLRLLGFVDAQSLLRWHLLRRVGAQVPHSAMPAFGPMSRSGRHTAIPALDGDPSPVGRFARQAQ